MSKAKQQTLLRLQAAYREAEDKYIRYARIEDRLTNAERADKARWLKRSQLLWNKLYALKGLSSL